MGGVGTFGVVACVPEVAVTPGELTERLKAEGGRLKARRRKASGRRS